jgi:uncharacterized protein YukE
MTEYRVDTNALDELNAQLRNLLGFTEDALVQVQQRMNALHDGDGAAEPWTGETAAAARDAMNRWVNGAQKMRDGLAKMEAASKTAHDSYAAGVTAILSTLDRPAPSEGGPA